MGSLSLVTMMRGAWLAVRHSVVVPALQVAVYLCAAMSLMLFVERLYMGLVVAGLWLRRRCNRRLNSAADEDDDKKLIMADSDDLESTGADRPMVLVQIPMFNEKQVSTANSTQRLEQ